MKATQQQVEKYVDLCRRAVELEQQINAVNKMIDDCRKSILSAASGSIEEHAVPVSMVLRMLDQIRKNPTDKLTGKTVADSAATMSAFAKALNK